MSGLNLDARDSQHCLVCVFVSCAQATLTVLAVYLDPTHDSHSISVCVVYFTNTGVGRIITCTEIRQDVFQLS